MIPENVNEKTESDSLDAVVGRGSGAREHNGAGGITVEYGAWIWQGEPRAGTEMRQKTFKTIEAARRWLAQQIAEWPEAFEYGIDHESQDGPVADFLSDTIKERMEASGVGWETFDTEPGNSPNDKLSPEEGGKEQR